MIKYAFNHKKGILETKFIGEVNLEEIIDYINKTKNCNNEYPSRLKIKTDATNAIFTFSIDDIQKIAFENDRLLENYDFLIDAIIVDSPQTTAFSILYVELGKNKKYKFNIFSTEKGASQWLEYF